MRGDYVVVRAHGDKALIRRVWTVGRGVVFVASEEQFMKLDGGQEAQWPVGFRTSDVFKYDPAVANLPTPKWEGAKLYLE